MQNTDFAADFRIREAEREALLERVINQLEADKRVVAAWLFGSQGRGESDALSDIDVRVVVTDEYSAEMNAARREYATRVGVPLLIQEEPHNAPAGGAFLLVMYEGSVGPLEVDWTWQPQSLARIPTDVLVLFDHVDLEHEAPVSRPTGQQLADELTKQMIFLWMMVPVTAKKIARRQGWTVLTVVNYTWQALEKVKWLVGVSNEPPCHENRQTGVLPVTPVEQMAHLRSLASEMDALTATIMALGGQVPTDVIKPAYRFCDLVGGVIAGE